MDGKEKTRDISQLEFLNVLQKEYVCSVIRYRIYFQNADKAFYKKVATKKKKYIEDIAEKNFLPTMFDSEDKKKEIYAQVFNKFGPPNFTYNPKELEKYEADRNKMFPYKTTIVRLKEKPHKVGITQRVDFEEKLVYITFEKEKEPEAFPYGMVELLSPVEKDYFYYYYPQSDVRVRWEGDEIKIGKITHNDYLEETVTVEFGDNQVYCLDYENVARII